MGNEVSGSPDFQSRASHRLTHSTTPITAARTHHFNLPIICHPVSQTLPQ
jgi:hypothetical protein